MPPRPMLIFSFQSDMSGRAFLAEQVWYETLSRRADLVDEACPKNSDRRDACMCAYSGRVVFLGSRVRACVCVCVFLTSRGFPLCARVRVFSLVRAVFLGSRVRVCFPWFARFSWVRACVCVFLGSRDFPWFARACVCLLWFARFSLLRACVCVFLGSRGFPWFARACVRVRAVFLVSRVRVCARVFSGGRAVRVCSGGRAVFLDFRAARQHFPLCFP